MSDEKSINSFGGWWAERLKIKEETLKIDGVEDDFLFLKLTSAMKKELINLKTVDEKLNYAAENGMSYGRDRIIDNKELKQDFAKTWIHFSPEFPPTPSIQHQCGQHVCDISGLRRHVEEYKEVEDRNLELQMQKEEDEVQAHKDNVEYDHASAIQGDNLPDDHVTMGQLEDDANQANAA